MIQSRALGALAIAAAALLIPASQAQQVYRIVGPDGKITFSDKPPPPAGNNKVSAGSPGLNAGAAVTSLPFELRQVAARYPVTLYTGENCGPCASARALLTTRGVPFTERTVTSADDAESLQRLSGDNGLPFATIGGQQLKGFSDAEWTQFLNAAGYPAASVLPSSYRQPAATPLVAIGTAGNPGKATNAAPVRAVAPTPAAQPADNPSGIRF